MAPALFVGVFLLAGALRPDYDAWREPISALSLGATGWLQRSSFVLVGVLSIGWSLGLRKTRGSAAAWVAPAQAIGALGLVIDGIFSQDAHIRYPPGALLPHLSTHAQIHLAAAMLVFLALPVCCLGFADYAAPKTGPRRWRCYSVTTALVFWLLVGLFFVSQVGLHGEAAGLFERLAVSVMACYDTVLSLRLVAAAKRSPSLPAYAGRHRLE